MMSGCGILTNGQGTRREYGHFNLDELREGDTIGIIRKSNMSLHYMINGMDQGVAVQHLPGPIWGVIDLYGMTVKVSIIDRDEDTGNLAGPNQICEGKLTLPLNVGIISKGAEFF